MNLLGRDNLTRTAWLGVPVVGALFIVLFLALPTGALEQSIVYDIAGLTAIAGAFLGIRLHRPDGWQPWAVMALGQLSFVLGDIIWTYFAAIGEDPFPSVADAAYLLGYPLLALGLGIAIRRRVRGGDRAGLLDGAILATGSVVVWWMFILGPLVEASDPDPLSFAIGVAYPIGDLLLLGLALSLVMTPGAKSASFRLLVANLVVLLVGDLVYSLQTIDGTYVDGGALDTVWLLGYTVFTMAALHPTMAVVFDPRPVAVALLGPVRLALLGVAMLVGPALLAIGHSDGESIIAVVAVASAVLSVLVLVRLAGMVGHLSRDIERRTVLEAQLSYQAFHDPLTGLANRRRFIDAVGDAIRAGAGAAVLFVDLDDFKHVNDGMGHDAGDALLTAVGHRLVSAIRPDDLGCRIGGDEFAVLLPRTPSADEAEPVARRLLEALAAPVEIEGREIVVPASIGVAAATIGERLEIDELLRRADVAMYHAKAQGKNRLATYSAAIDAPMDAAPAAVPGRTPAESQPRHVRAGTSSPTTLPGAAS
jgi:diguanylate cyclase (GGDEF)-like protein